jgi:hypothetical protein
MYLSQKTMATEELEDFSIKEKDTVGYERWVDAEGFPHREDGPAYITSTQESWFKHGTLYRIDGPAFIVNSLDGLVKGWLVNGKYHREDGPAYIDNNKIVFYINGTLVTEETVRALGKMK